MRRLEDRIVIVTGAGRGIGGAAATRLAAEGAIVWGVDLDADALAEHTELAGHSVADVADYDQCAEIVAGVVAAHGRLDGLANCAGIGMMRRTEEHGIDEWRRVLSVNLDGTFFMCRAAIDALLDGGGAIVNLASVAGLRGQPYSAAYCASKGGVISLTQALGIEYRNRGVRANCIAPGGVATDFAASLDFSGLDWDEMRATVMRITDPIHTDEIAAAIAYLLSDEARSITTEVLRIDKGLLAM